MSELSFLSFFYKLSQCFNRCGVMGLITLISAPRGSRNSTSGFAKETGLVVDTFINVWIKVKQQHSSLPLCFLFYV